MTRIVIIGGSLAGATCALVLARNGHDVIVVEKRAAGIQKACGQGMLPLGVERLTQLGLGHLFDDVESPAFVGVEYHLNSTSALGHFESGVGRGVHRGRLDHALREAAETAGVRFMRETFKSIELDSKSVRIHLESGTVLDAEFAVGADGLRSKVRRSLGLEKKKSSNRYAIVQDFAWSGPLPDRVQVHNAEGFELYLTPVAPGQVGLAALCSKSALPKRNKDNALQTLIAKCPSFPAHRFGDFEARSALRACGPLRSASKASFKGRAILIGDAAGYVDALTGEGMSLAIETATLAASAIERCTQGARVKRSFKRYSKARRRVFRDHAILTHGLLWLSKHPRLAERTISLLNVEPSIFTRLLEINNGKRSFFSFTPWMLLKLALGKSTKKPSHMREGSLKLDASRSELEGEESGLRPHQLPIVRNRKKDLLFGRDSRIENETIRDRQKGA